MAKKMKKIVKKPFYRRSIKEVLTGEVDSERAHEKSSEFKSIVLSEYLDNYRKGSFSNEDKEFYEYFLSFKTNNDEKLYKHLNDFSSTLLRLALSDLERIKGISRSLNIAEKIVNESSNVKYKIEYYKALHVEYLNGLKVLDDMRESLMISDYAYTKAKVNIKEYISKNENILVKLGYDIKNANPENEKVKNKKDKFVFSKKYKEA